MRIRIEETNNEGRVMRTKIKRKNLLNKLRENLPEFKSIEKKESIEPSDEPNYIMVILNKFLTHYLRRQNREILTRMGKFLDECWTNAERDIQNTLMVSFFESLSERSYNRIKPYLSPNTLKEVDHYKKSLEKLKDER